MGGEALVFSIARRSDQTIIEKLKSAKKMYTKRREAMRNNKHADMGAMHGALFLDKCIESGTPMHVIGSGSLHPNSCTPISGEIGEGNIGKKTASTEKENMRWTGRNSRANQEEKMSGTVTEG